MNALSFLDYVALATMLCVWLFYDKYATYQSSKGKKSLMSISNSMRMHWVHNLMHNKSMNRIADSQLTSILHKGISFFISITIFIIGGLIAMLNLNSGNTILLVLSKLPFYASNAEQTWSIKVIFMIIIFVVTFFRLTWSLRQNQYYAVAICGAPRTELKNKSDYDLVKSIAKLMSECAKNFNNALRSYYFGLSIMTWFIHPVLFMISNVVVVWVTYRREFYSKTLGILDEINQSYNESHISRRLPD